MYTVVLKNENGRNPISLIQKDIENFRSKAIVSDFLKKIRDFFYRGRVKSIENRDILRNTNEVQEQGMKKRGWGKVGCYQ